MKDRDQETGLSSIYPLTRAEIAQLPLADAESELRESILAEQEPVHATERPRGRRARHWGLAGGAGLVAAALLAIFLLPGPGPETGKSSPAFAAGLVRTAKSTPLVLLEEPGWRVGADTSVALDRGRMQFVGPAGPSGKGGRESAELRWWKGDVGAKLLKRFAEHAPYTIFLLPRPTSNSSLKIRDLQIHVTGGRSHRRFTAVWEDHGRTLVFDSAAANASVFQKRLGSLHRVGAIAWLTALPEDLTRRGAAGRKLVRHRGACR